MKNPLGSSQLIRLVHAICTYSYIYCRDIFLIANVTQNIFAVLKAMMLKSNTPKIWTKIYFFLSIFSFKRMKNKKLITANTSHSEALEIREPLL